MGSTILMFSVEKGVTRSGTGGLMRCCTLQSPLLGGLPLPSHTANHLEKLVFYLGFVFVARQWSGARPGQSNPRNVKAFSEKQNKNFLTILFHYIMFYYITYI